MKLTRNRLKELIRQSIREIDFEDEESFKKYQSQHKMRPDTKVNIGGKDTTVGQAGDSDGDGDIDRGGESKSISGIKSGVKNLKSAAANGKKAQSDLEAAKESKNPFGKKKKIAAAQQALDIAKQEYEKAEEGLQKSLNDRAEAVNSGKEPPATKKEAESVIKQAEQKRQYALDARRGAENPHAMSFSPDTLDAIEKDAKRAKAVAEKTKGMMDDLPDSLGSVSEGGPGSGRPKGSNSDRAFNKKYKKDPAYDKNYISDPLPDRSKKKKTNESVRKPRKTTVKEVKKWFKTLEENRYKKTYASDARRVSWIVNNNLSEDYESMPVSMRKKWSKAQYGREKFLAKEFVKHLRNTAKLRESIRRIVRGLIND